MAPRDSGKAVDAQEIVLHAVVLADAPSSARRRWGPVLRGNNGEADDDMMASSMHSEADDRAGPSTASPDILSTDEPLPWCLMPLAGAPLLAWTLEALSAAGVRRAYLFASTGVEQIRSYIRSSPFASGSLEVKIRRTTATTEGGVLQEADSLALPGDFILARVGYVGNVDLAAALARFAAKRQADKGLLMDCLLAPIRTSAASHTSLYTLAGEHDQLVHYQTSRRFPRRRRAKVPTELFLDGAGKVAGGLSVRMDLGTIGIDICSNEVPPLFSENFDYRSVRPHFIDGILFHRDLLGKSIACSVVGDAVAPGRRAADWALFVDDPASFERATQAVMSRLVYPLAPDENLPGTERRYERRRDRVYVGTRVDLHRTARVGFSMLGSRTVVADESAVSGSVLGSSVAVGSRCSITRSFVHSRARIGDGCTLNRAIVAAGAVIGDGSTLRAGAIVGPGAVVGKGALVAGHVAADEHEGEGGPASNDNLGEGAQAYAWPDDRRYDSDDGEDSDDEGEAAIAATRRNIQLAKLGARLSDLSPYSSPPSSASSLSVASSSDGESATDIAAGIANISVLAEAAAGDGEPLPLPLAEIHETLDRSLAHDDTVDNAALELMNLRLVYPHATPDRLRDVVAIYLAELIVVGTPYAQIERTIGRWSGLVRKLATSNEADMVAVANALQQHCTDEARPQRAKLLPYLLRAFYEAEDDVLTEDALVAWAKSAESRRIAAEGDELGKRAREAGLAFVKALMETSEDEDESD